MKCHKAMSMSKELKLRYDERNIQFPLVKMTSYGQPYNEIGSSMVRALALYLEGREFDSGRDCHDEIQIHDPFQQLLVILRHFL